jgi:hypothetical protein
MATSEADIQKMFGGMDARAPRLPPAAPGSVAPARDEDSLRRMFDGLDSAPVDDRVGAMFDQMDAARQKPSIKVTTRDDVDFDAPLPSAVEGFKPVDFQPFETSDLSFTQRVAAGGARIAGANTSGLPENSPNRGGKLIKAQVRTDGRMPSQDELSDALLSALGAGEVGQRYRAETGHNIAVPDISEADLKHGYDQQAQTYHFAVQPTRADVRIINAYGRGGIKAAEDEIELMRGEGEETNAQYVRERDAARKIITGLGYDPDKLSEGNGPIAKGIGDAMIGTARLANNLGGVFGSDSQGSADNAEFIDEMGASIPEEKTGVGRMARSLTGIAARAPQYALAGPALVAYTENLDKGQERAIKEALKIGMAGGVARGAGAAFESLSPAARQVASRFLAGQTNVALDKLSGSDRSAVESFLESALLPVGKGKGKGSAETAERFTHPSLGELEAVADQSGIGENFMRVRRVEDGDVGVVRRPGAPMPAGLHPESELKPTSKVGEKVLDLVNVPRAVQTSYDLSGLGRQGLILSVLHPGKAAKAFARSLPTLFSEAKADDVLREIHSSPLAPLRRDAGLYLADYHKSGLSLTAGEEGFQSSIAQSIPGVRASERAYVAFLNKLRADTWDSFYETHPNATPETLKNIAGFVNTATGRGSLGRWGEKHASALSQILYSPRFTVSRVQTALTPFHGTPEARSYAAKELVKFVGAGIGFMGLAKAAGLDVSVDPLSSDFGKVRVGNSRIDLWGSSAQLARYTAQIIAGKSTSLEDGATQDRARWKTALNFLRTKAAPQISVPLDTLIGSDVKGQPATLSNAPKRAFLPLAWNDVIEAVQDDLAQGGTGWGGAAKGSLGLFGFGVNTITPKTLDERISDETQWLKNEPESEGLTDAQLRHNGKVSLEARRLQKLIDESGLTPEQQGQLRHALNSRFYDARVRGSADRRVLPSIERVFEERSKGAEEFLRERIEEMRGKGEAGASSSRKLSDYSENEVRAHAGARYGENPAMVEGLVNAWREKISRPEDSH